MKRWFYTILLVIIISPVLFININHLHDWGDDCFQYLDQARDFFFQRNKGTPGIIDYVEYAPTQRGEGFSLLLSPIFIWSNHISAFILFISFSLFLLGLVLLKFFQEELEEGSSKIIPLLMVICLIYNYHVLKLKMEIMPVFPFMLVLYSCVLLVKKRSTLAFVGLAFLTGLMISIANVGFCFYITGILQLSWMMKKGFEQQKLKRLIFFIFIPVIVHLFIKWLIHGGISLESILWYDRIFSFSAITETFAFNVNYYLQTLQIFFEQEVWGWLNILIWGAVFVLLAVGMIHKFRYKFGWVDSFFVLYFLILLCYPHHRSGMRFMIPLMPIILMYIMNGIQFISSKMKLRSMYIALPLLLIIAGSNFINVRNLIAMGDKNIYGPLNEEAIEAFAAVKQVVPTTEIIAFSKPWAIHYYTDRRALYFDPSMDLEATKNKLSKSKVGYILLCNDERHADVFTPRILAQMEEDDTYVKLWANHSFSLYKER